MPKFKFSKLARDKIVEQQIASGAKPVYRQLSHEEHKQELVNKVIEEVKEIPNANIHEVASEIADVQQALDDLRYKLGFTAEEIASAQAIKKSKNGTFEKGMYIDYVELDEEEDEWTSYYRQNPDRYPEIT